MLKKRKKNTKRIILPLDFANEKEALSYVEKLKDYVDIFKVGLELITSVGPGIIQKINGLGGQVFYDGKFKDIPNTVAGAARAVTKQNIYMFNVHAMGGAEMMKAALDASQKEAKTQNIKRPFILGVTILTSIDKKMMNDDLKIKGEVEDQVVHLAKLTKNVGLDGIIASPKELKLIREQISEDILIVTPGVRPSWASHQDQKRVMTPSEAIILGASYLVIGRPITQPPEGIKDSVEAAKKITEEIEIALSS